MNFRNLLGLFAFVFVGLLLLSGVGFAANLGNCSLINSGVLSNTTTHLLTANISGWASTGCFIIGVHADNNSFMLDCNYKTICYNSQGHYDGKNKQYLNFILFIFFRVVR